jgi:hypothetical protein
VSEGTLITSSCSFLVSLRQRIGGLRKARKDRRKRIASNKVEAGAVHSKGLDA